MNEINDPLVTICCITYNHEKYIRDAIEGFLMQKTDFAFEIIIHDDASTDMTANIIKEYEIKYPQIIKPIYQTENQYSKGIKPSTLVFKQSKGKYIAFCEGDDYWIDPFKLQKQINEMEKHSECHVSFHPAILKWEDGSKKDKTMCFYSKKNKIFTVEEVILGDGGFIPTNSIIFNRIIIPRYISFFNRAKKAPMGDYYLQIISSENGGALYIKDIMSVYTRRVIDSWSARLNESVMSNNLFLTSLIDTNEEMDKFTGYKYHTQLQIMNQKMVSNRLKSIKVNVDIRRNAFESFSEYMSFKDKVLWHTIFAHPLITNFLQRVRDVISRTNSLCSIFKIKL